MTTTMREKTTKAFKLKERDKVGIIKATTMEKVEVGITTITIAIRATIKAIISITMETRSSRTMEIVRETMGTIMRGIKITATTSIVTSNQKTMTSDVNSLEL